MTIKVVTDSSADLPTQLAKELGITVVPLYVRFGKEVYRDGVDISEDEFYQRLLHDPIHPGTIQPAPKDFANVYQKLSGEADGIISIHISGKLSGTYSSALQGKELIEKGYPIEVVDSQMLGMGLGMLAMAATTAAREGKSLPQVVKEVKQIIPDIHLVGLLDTLKYLALGGRIGKVTVLLGSLLNVKPVLMLKDGEVMPAGRVRTRAKGIDWLFDFVRNATDIQDLAIEYSTASDDVQTLAERIGSVFPKERIRVARLGPVLGVHAGPGVLFIAFRVKRPITRE